MRKKILNYLLISQIFRKCSRFQPLEMVRYYRRKFGRFETLQLFINAYLDAYPEIEGYMDRCCTILEDSEVLKRVGRIHRTKIHYYVRKSIRKEEN
jgi:hypothetical protein